MAEKLHLRNENIATIIFIIFWEFLMFYQILPQTKRSVVINNKQCMHKLPHKLANNIRLIKLGKVQKISKLQRIIT